MEMEKIAVLPIDRAKLDRLFPRMSGVYQAVNDISVANHLEILERPIPSPRPDPTILNLTAISFAS
jgi:hypothetical protein